MAGKDEAKKKRVGLWIDHRKAVIVSLTAEGEKTDLIQSNMEEHVRFSGGAQDVSAENQRDRRFAGHLDKYYDEVIACLKDAESILIFGPGEAKGELQKHLESGNLGERIIGIETVDKMTDRQIAAQVRRRLVK